VAVDHCTEECVGLHAAKKSTRFAALERLQQGVRDPQTARPRQPIPGRRQSGGNRLSGHAVFANSLERQPHGSVEPFIRTLKEQLLWVRVFQNIEELRCALASRSCGADQAEVDFFAYLLPSR
jgi:putative transposase